MTRLLAATALCIAAAPSAAQEARAVLMHQDGHRVGTVTLTQMENGVLIEAGLIEMAPGEYGFHIHETGACDPDFSAAGGHFAPRGNAHGFDNPDGPHAGDLPNVEVLEAGRASIEFINSRLSMRDGAEDNLMDDDGAAIVIHADRDTYTDEPSVEGRLACGALEPV